MEAEIEAHTRALVEKMMSELFQRGAILPQGETSSSTQGRNHPTNVRLLALLNKEHMKTTMNECDETSEVYTSWKNDIYSKVKGPEKKGRVRCVGSIASSSKTKQPPSQVYEENQELREKIKGLEGLFTGMLTVLQSRFGDEEITNIANAANRLFNKEVPEANSCPENSPNNVLHSSSSSRRDSNPNATLPQPHSGQLLQANPESSENSTEMVNYMPTNPGLQSQISLEKLSFADVMQFAEFGPKLAHQVLHDDPPMNSPRMMVEKEEEEKMKAHATGEEKEAATGMKSGRKRPRATKTREEVESQRMTHIAVERNRRRQMNEHLRVLRSIMPRSYVQRGDQASIVGGAIEFVRELEQLLQCLESQKRRRLFDNCETSRSAMELPSLNPFGHPFPDSDQVNLREEMAENKSCLADVEVRLLGFDAMIKILSRRRPGQLLKTIAALEDLQFTILHSNITTVEQTVLYSFNVKIANETVCTAEDIANSVQQILSFIDANVVN
ncbi:transcription factor FAMA [Canna indica]|uniref:Transcription factor FAMA n=1 Tax=Canna indica TaxID=4628 RepID=A0AAQ3K3S7_9LILI|nr:transcription factor FAMA [Canna indica]